MIIRKQLNGGSLAPTLVLEVTTQSQSIPNNTTTLNYVFSIQRPSQVNSDVPKSYSLAIGGETITGSTTIGGTDTKIIRSGTSIVEHNADGTKVINCSFSIDVAITWSGVYNGVVSNNGTLTLPTIARATTPSVPASATLNATIQITLPRKSNSFKHDLFAIINGNNVTIARNVQTIYNWTIPISIANYITQTSSAACQIKCNTYDDDTLIGTKYASMVLNVPSSIIPSINSVSVAEGAGITIDYFVQGKSKLNVVVNASGVYGSTIKKIKSTLDGVIYNGSSFTTETLNFNSTKNLVVVITDSRGRTNTYTQSITPLEYEAPKILQFDVNRCLQDGTLDDSGTYLKIDYSFSISPLADENTKQVEFYYETQQSYDTFETITSDYEKSGSFITDITFSTSISYLLRMKVIDMFTDVKAYVNIDTEVLTFDIHSSGQGIALGKVAESQNLLDVNWQARFRQQVTFYRDVTWTNLTLNSAWACYDGDTDNNPKYRIKGDIVEVRGMVSPVTAHTSTNTRETIATLPVGARPSSAIYLVCQGSNKNTWLFSIQPSGEITFSRYGTTSNASVPTSAWLPFQATFILD